MTLQQTLEALDVLANLSNSDVAEYIKTFNGKDGFSYTVETEPSRIALKKKMETIIDESPHSGASWGWMLRLIQAVLNGVYTYEQLVIEKNKQDEEYVIWRREYELKKELEQQNILTEEIQQNVLIE